MASDKDKRGISAVVTENSSPSSRHYRPTIARIAVPSPLRQCFDYWVPSELGPVAPGMRVQVPFGRGNRIGIVVESPVESSVSLDHLKAVSEVIDRTPTLPADTMRLLRWASDYYHHPIGEVMQTALPATLRRGKATPKLTQRWWRCTESGRTVDPAALGRAVRQIALLRSLQAAAVPVLESDLTQYAGWRNNLARLETRGWVISAEQPPSNAPKDPRDLVLHELNPSQASAARIIGQGLGAFTATLLDGVTGSGKTEVYLDVIREVLARGQQVLVLVPEIGLTPQIVLRFTDAVPGRIAVLHSNMSDRSRAAAWIQARDGEVDVVIGTRSAVFVPLQRPGLFVVDEEHDVSFKQQDGFRYSARDLCVYRARVANAPIVLGSATPSLESLHNCARSRYQHVLLANRVAGRPLPEMHIVDVRKRPLDEGLCEPLTQAIGKRLGRGEQSLLFVNRRGFAPVLLCHECGWVHDCKRCDSHMVVHAASRRSRCHHCGADRPSPKRCHACESPELVAIGTGTERVAATLANRFPQARIARIDRDTMRRQGALGEVLGRIREHSVDIVVGTQMVAKGHDFPQVTLVGVLDADGGLFGADFRASERMAQLIVQVAGRAGRGHIAGEVLVQTHHPSHPLLQALRDSGYGAFARSALEERADAALPPFAALALLRAESAQRELAFNFLTQAKRLAQEWADTWTGTCAGDAADPGVAILGPAAAPMERRGGRYRAQLLLHAQERKTLHRMVGPWLGVLSRLSTGRKVRWSIDVDPQEML